MSTTHYTAFCPSSIGASPQLRRPYMHLAKPALQIRSTRLRSYIYSAAVAPSQTAFVLHVDQTTISFPLKPESGRELSAALQELLQTFAAKQKAERPKRWKSMEFRLKGESEQAALEYLEIFCNPNAASTAFDAKALITLRTKDGVKLSTEGRLSALKEDLDSFLQQHC